MGTIANVLVGVAEVGIKNPYDESIAEFSTEQHFAGNYSAKLRKSGNGTGASSCHLQITPPAGITMTAFAAGIVAGSYGFYHHSALDVPGLGNFAQMEFRFESPIGTGYVELTCVPLQSLPGTGAWVAEAMPDTTKSGFDGRTNLGAVMSNWVLANISVQVAAIAALDATAGTWLLTRVRLELWELGVARTCYIDQVKINAITYTIEPGGTVPGLRFGTYTDLGYTEDGVTVEYTAAQADIDVEEETFSIDRVITKESVNVTLNMAEASLANLNAAMAGGVLVGGNHITFGEGVNKKLSLQVVGRTPAGFLRTYSFPKVTASGGVNQAYKKGSKIVTPVTFQVLKGSGDAFILVDNAA